MSLICVTIIEKIIVDGFFLFFFVSSYFRNSACVCARVCACSFYLKLSAYTSAHLSIVFFSQSITILPFSGIHLTLDLLYLSK